MTKIAVHPEFIAIHTGSEEPGRDTVKIVPAAVTRLLKDGDVFILYEDTDTNRCWYMVEGVYPETGESLKEISSYTYDGETITIRIPGEVDARRYTVEAA